MFFAIMYIGNIGFPHQIGPVFANTIRKLLVEALLNRPGIAKIGHGMYRTHWPLTGLSVHAGLLE